MIVAAVRWWRAGSCQLPWRWAALHVGLVFAFFAVPLVTSWNQAPVDIAYQFRPWSGQTGEGFEVDNPLLSDVPLQMVPFRTLVRDRLLSLEAPLWSHELGTGQPLLGNAQSAPFAPLHLPALPLPPVRALTVAAAWQLVLGALLVHALVLALAPTLDRAPAPAPWPVHAGAALGAVAYAFSGYSTVWLYHPLSMVAMWIPGVLLGILALARGERRALPGLVVCAWAMAVSGHPETVGRARFAGRAATAVLLAACFAAPALLPVVEVLPESERKSVLDDLGERPIGLPDFAPSGFLPVAQPLAFGTPRDGDWDGPGNYNEYTSQYAGAAALAIALVAAGVLGWRRGWRKLLALLGAGLFGLLVALNVPPFLRVIDSLPGLEYAAHGRLRLFWALAVALVAGLALPRLAHTRGGAVAGVMALAAVAVVLFAVPPPFGSAHQRLWWWVVLAGLAAAAATLAVPPWRRAFPAVALAVVVADLFVLGVRYHALVPGELDLSPDDPPPAIAWLVERQEASRAPFRVHGEGPDLFPNLPAVYGLWSVRGNDPMQPRAASLVVGRRLGAHFWADPRPGRWARRDPGMLRMLGVHYLVTPTRRRMPADDWQPVLEAGGARVWRLREPLPLFFVPERVVAVADPRRERIASFRTVDFGDRTVVADPAGGRGVEGPLPMREQEGRVWLRVVRPNGFELTARSERGAVVASSVSRVRGWRLRIDGEPAEPLTVNSGFLGFRVPPGVHAVSLGYTPAGWRWGWVLFGGASLAVLGSAFRRSSS